jgi:hypothetical protein
VKIEGLGFVFEAMNDTPGRCGACGATLPPFAERTRAFTCDDICHAVWIDRLVKQYGGMRIVTLAETGKRYMVPTRDILEKGIDARRLVTYPEAPPAP